METYEGKNEKIVSRDNTRSSIQNPVESSQFVEQSQSLSVLFFFFFLLPLTVSRQNTARMIRSSRFRAVARIEFLAAVTLGRSCRDANSSGKSRSWEFRSMLCLLSKTENWENAVLSANVHSCQIIFQGVPVGRWNLVSASFLAISLHAPLYSSILEKYCSNHAVRK